MKHLPFVKLVKPAAMALMASIVLTACGQIDNMNFADTDWSDLNSVPTQIVPVN